MFVLDTNVISELRKLGDRRVEPNVFAWAASVPGTALYLSAMTLMEIELGILRLERRGQNHGAQLRIWMKDHILPEFATRILPVDATVALRAASLHTPVTRPDRDALIAATALVHGMTVATRNVADFVPMGVTLLNPWDP